MAHDKFYGVCENKCLIEINADSVGAAAADHKHTPEEIGAATADHQHTAEEIGAATAGHTHTPEEIGAAAADHAHDASAITTGIMQLEHGGTGGATATAARTNLEVMKGTILYDNASGTTGTITLSDDISNYEYLEIYDFVQYSETSKIAATSTRYQIGTSWTACVGATYASSAPGIAVRTALIHPSGTTITWERNAAVFVDRNGFVVDDTPIKITRVVGYSY